MPPNAVRTAAPPSGGGRANESHPGVHPSRRLRESRDQVMMNSDRMDIGLDEAGRTEKADRSPWAVACLKKRHAS